MTHLLLYFWKFFSTVINSLPSSHSFVCAKKKKSLQSWKDILYTRLNSDSAIKMYFQLYKLTPCSFPVILLTRRTKTKKILSFSYKCGGGDSSGKKKVLFILLPTMAVISTSICGREKRLRKYRMCLCPLKELKRRQKIGIARFLIMKRNVDSLGLWCLLYLGHLLG